MGGASGVGVGQKALLTCVQKRGNKLARKSTKKPTTRMGKCSFCEKPFNWITTPAVVNAAKKEFCGHECFSKNLENVARLTAATDFDSL